MSRAILADFCGPQEILTHSKVSKGEVSKGVSPLCLAVEPRTGFAIVFHEARLEAWKYRPLT